MAKFWSGLAVAALLILAGCAAPNVDGTTTAPVTKQHQFYDGFVGQYPHLKAALDHDAKPETYTIPGLLRTKTLTVNGGKVGTSTTMDPQGLAVTGKQVIISAYSRDKKYHSVLYVLNQRTGAFEKQIVLPDASHVGGLAYDPVAKRLWVTIESAGGAALAAYDAKTLSAASFAAKHRATAYDHVVKLPQIPRASFITYHKNALYVGYFGVGKAGKFRSYPLNDAGLPQTKQHADLDLRGAGTVAGYSTNKSLQGVAFYQGKLLFSQSYGPKPSSLLVFDNDGQKKWLDFDGDDTLQSIAMPPYLEQIVVSGNDLYVLFESASAKYRHAKLDFHADRVIKLELDDLVK